VLFKGVTREIISVKNNMDICPYCKSETIFLSFFPHKDHYGRRVCVCVCVCACVRARVRACARVLFTHTHRHALHTSTQFLNINLNETWHAISMLQQAFLQTVF